MGVYIEGMEMPEFGEKIIILTSSGYVEDVSGQVIDGVKAISVLTPHRNLIDAEALAEHVRQQSDWLSETAIHTFCGILCKAPTIIPAEED